VGAVKNEEGIRDPETGSAVGIQHHRMFELRMQLVLASQRAALLKTSAPHSS
jgi:hypothetical protein